MARHLKRSTKLSTCIRGDHCACDGSLYISHATKMLGIRTPEDAVPARGWTDGRPGSRGGGGVEREERTRERDVELDDELVRGAAEHAFLRASHDGASGGSRLSCAEVKTRHLV